MAKRDYYEVLGIEKSADGAAVKAAYRQLVKKYHPDLNPGDKTAEDKMKEVNEAYEVLSDDTKRGNYDQFGHADPGGGYAQGGGGYGGNGDFGGFGFEDILGSLFGNAFGGGSRRQAGPVPGNDLRHDVTITLEEAFNGAQREIRFARKAHCDACHGSGAEPGTSSETCPDCKGTGQVRTVQRTPFGAMQSMGTCQRCRGVGKIIKSPCTTCHGTGIGRKNRVIDLKIHPGVEHGQRIPVRGEGEPGERGGQHGDLYVFINIKDHPVFLRKGPDLFRSIPIDYTTAALGREIEIPGIDGKTISTKLKPGTQPGEVIKLTGQGMPVAGGGRRGVLYVTATLEVPKSLSSEEKKLLEELEALKNPDAKGKKGRFRK